GGPGLVVVFEEAGELVLIVESGKKMFAHGAGMAVAQAIVEPLVVGVIKPLLLESPFLIPIDFGHEAEIGMVLSDRMRGARPKEQRPLTPRAIENFGQDEHGHVAAQTVAL